MFLKKITTFLLFLSIYSIASDCSKWTIIPHALGTHLTVPICRTASDFGAVGDGVTDDTYALKEAFASGVKLDLEGKKYLIDVSKPELILGLRPSDYKIIEGNGAEIILKPNNLEVYSMVNLINSKNVKIYDLKLTGDVRNHKGSTGEWGMGFWMGGSKNCELHRVEANEMWGDGFYVNGYKQEATEDGGIFNSSARANRRLGLCVTTCKNFIVKDSTFANAGSIRTTFPSYGIDIEPNVGSYDSIEGLKLINIKTENNRHGAILFVPRVLTVSTKPNAVFNVYVEKFVSKNDGNIILRFEERYEKNIYSGFVSIKGFDIINPKLGALPFRWNRNDASTIEVNAVGLRIDGVTQYDYHY